MPRVSPLPPAPSIFSFKKLLLRIHISVICSLKSSNNKQAFHGRRIRSSSTQYARVPEDGAIRLENRASLVVVCSTAGGGWGEGELFGKGDGVYPCSRYLINRVITRRFPASRPGLARSSGVSAERASTFVRRPI